MFIAPKICRADLRRIFARRKMKRGFLEINKKYKIQLNKIILMSS